MRSITELKPLSVPERLQLVENLWDSIASDQMALPDYPQFVEEVRLRRAKGACFLPGESPGHIKE